MAKIHWLVYFIVGLLVSVLSWRLNKEKLIFFFYIGLIFIVVSIAKLIFGIIKKSSNKKENKHQKIQTQKQRIQHFKRCSRCGNVIRINEGFCSVCGARV